MNERKRAASAKRPSLAEGDAASLPALPADRAEEIAAALEWLALWPSERRGKKAPRLALGPSKRREKRIPDLTPLSDQEKRAILAAARAAEVGIGVEGILIREIQAEMRLTPRSEQKTGRLRPILDRNDSKTLSPPGTVRPSAIVPAGAAKRLSEIIRETPWAFDSSRFRHAFFSTLQRLPQDRAKRLLAVVLKAWCYNPKRTARNDELGRLYACVRMLRAYPGGTTGDILRGLADGRFDEPFTKKWRGLPLSTLTARYGHAIRLFCGRIEKPHTRRRPRS